MEGNSSTQHDALASITVACDAVTSGLTALRQRAYGLSDAEVRDGLRDAFRLVAMTQSLAAMRRMNLYWGVSPLHIPDVANTDELIAVLEKVLVEKGFSSPGQPIVICSNVPAIAQQNTNFLKLHRIAS